MSGQRTPLAARFWSRFVPEPNSGCWLWTGYVDRRGYGRIWAGGRNSTSTGAHRLALELAGRPAAADQVVLHSCDTPCCVNPDHLRAGTQGENIAEMFARGRARSGAAALRGRKRMGWVHPNSLKTHCKHGHPLTADNVTVSRGVRCCRACWRAKAAVKRAKRKETTT